MPGSCICSGLPVANCLRQLCPLGTRSLSAQASACGSPSGCPRARGVRCRIAPCRSLCSPPTLPAGRFGLRPRPHWGHASLRDSSLRSPAGKKPFIAHFGGGARNVARNGVGQLSHTGGVRSCSPFSAVKMDGPFSLRCLSPLCSPTAGARQTQPMRVGILHCSLVASQRNKMGLAAFLDLLDPSQTASLGMLRCSLDIFATQKTSVVSFPRWPLLQAGGPVARRRSFLFN